MEPNGGTAGISPARQFSQVIDRQRLDGVWLGARPPSATSYSAVRFPLANYQRRGGPFAIITSRDKNRPPAVWTIAIISLFFLAASLQREREREKGGHADGLDDH